MEFKKLEKILKKYKNLLIYIKGSPDPDSMASSLAMKIICEHMGIKAIIDSPEQPSLPQNLKMIKYFDLPIHFEKPPHNNNFDGYIILDHPDPRIEDTEKKIPCVLHIDHHQIIKSSVKPDFRIILPDASSTGSIMTILLNQIVPDFFSKSPFRKKCASALYYGMLTDTNNLELISYYEKEAIKIISSEIDKKLINRLIKTPFSKDLNHLINYSLQNHIIKDDWLIIGIGYLEAKKRDLIALIGDFLLKREDISKVIVFSIIEKKDSLILDASIRAKKKKFNISSFIKKITPSGGARNFKGAFQIDLDYFRFCPDKQMLWDLIYITTLEAIHSGSKMTIKKSIINIFKKKH